MLLWFMWHFEQILYLLLYFMLFMGHFFKNTHTAFTVFTLKRNMFTEPAIFELGSGCIIISNGFLAFQSNYTVYIFYLDWKHTTHSRLIAVPSYPEWRSCTTVIYFPNNMMLLFYGKPKWKNDLIFVSFALWVYLL